MSRELGADPAAATIEAAAATIDTSLVSSCWFSYNTMQEIIGANETTRTRNLTILRQTD
jgi:hypothetical protein